MSINLKEGIDTSSGRLEFYLVGLDLDTDFDNVIESLADIRRLSAVETIEGIWFRIGKFETGDLHFNVVYHEDVGLYAFSTDSTDQSNERLRYILKDVVEDMNRKA